MAEPLIAGLLPAAGGSVRLGRPKQLVELGGKALVRRMAERLLAQTTHVVVVTGSHAEEVRAALGDLPVRTVHNARWQEGMGGSIAAGADALGGGFDGVLILLCDQWRIDGNDLETLSRAWRREPSRIVAARWQKAYGPPAIFPGDLLDALGSLSGDRGAKALLEGRDDVLFVRLPNAGSDLDAPADLEAFEALRGTEA